MKNKISKLVKKALQKIHDKSEYLLETSKDERKVDRRIRKAGKRASRAYKRAVRFGKLRDFRPFDWEFIRKIEVKNDRFSEAYDDSCGIKWPPVEDYAGDPISIPVEQ